MRDMHESSADFSGSCMKEEVLKGKLLRPARDIRSILRWGYPKFSTIRFVADHFQLVVRIVGRAGDAAGCAEPTAVGGVPAAVCWLVPADEEPRTRSRVLPCTASSAAARSRRSVVGAA